MNSLACYFFLGKVVVV